MYVGLCVDLTSLLLFEKSTIVGCFERIVWFER